ncbi:LysR family transcriptional regulator [uncultured Cohaesibacter sp.]|uniref:LysR family transcriptional regulator n=1 Tax=uncultured Cohaesibacter sp. TaxID=1002546 RepID=UPI0029C83167|nr:LysR family transcriptional regulator [uncultured Cohaesibacter sp.]
MFSEILKELPTFLAVVDAGSFTAAAKRLHLTRSAVAKSVGRLETRLDAQLFNRTTRKLALTDEGAHYYEHCNRLMADLRDAGALLHKRRTFPVGRVRISVPVLFGRRCVAPVLRGLLREHPHLKIDVEFSDALVDVTGGGYDLVVRIGTSGDTNDLMTRKIGAQDMAIFASPRYLAEYGAPSVIEDLNSHVGILYGRSARGSTWRLRDADGANHDVLMKGRQRYGDLDVVLDAAIEGGGLAWLPRWLGAPSVAAGALQSVLDREQTQSIDIYIVWPKSRYLPLRTRTVINSLVTELPAFMR